MSLEGAYDPENIFAKILRGDAPSHTVFEDEAALAFLDIFPQSYGHTLVLPKTAARTVFDISADALAGVITRVQTIAAAVRDELQPDGVVLTQFNGAPAGQTVFHLHFHIIPRWEAVALAGHGQAGRADDGELAALAQRIKARLAR